jgi:hypothetical protein
VSNLTQSHRHAWEMIPWILNGSASEAQTRSAQEHLRQCADCREAFAFEQQLREAMMQPQTNLSDAEEGWQRLCARLDSTPESQKHWRETSRQPMRTRTRASGGIPVRWLAAAVIVEALALGAIVTASWINGAGRQPASAYHTLSRPEAVSAAPTIRMVLAPGMTLEQFRVLLNNAHLQVVAGPGEAGVWSLAPTEDATTVATEAALRELRGNPQVRFAEPIGAGAHASPP